MTVHISADISVNTPSDKPSNVVYLNHWSGDGPVALTSSAAPQRRAEVVALYALESLELRRYRSLLIPANADQRYLETQQQRLEGFLEAGGTVVVNGHVAYPFLRWLQPFCALPVLPHRALEALRVHRARPHPIFAGVDPEHLTFRRGVAGFYARGSNPPAPGAVVLNTLGPDAVPIDWLLCLPGGGRLLVHSGNDLWMFHGSDDSTNRIVGQLFDWLERGDA